MPSNNYYNNYRKRKKKKRWFIEIITAVAAVIMIICAYSGAVDPEKFFPAPFLMLAYMPMLMLVTVLLVLALLLRRWIAIAVIIVALIITVPTFKLYVPFNTNENRPPMPADTTLILKVMTYNVLAFNYNEPKIGDKPSATMKLILDANPDVVVLQEGSCRGLDWSDVPSLKPYIGQMKARYPYIYQSNEGLSMMSKFPFTTVALGEPQNARSPLGYNRDQSSYLARAYDLELPMGKQLRIIDFRLQSYHLSFGKNMSVRVSPDAKPSAMERMKRSFALRGNDAVALRAAIDDSPGNVLVCGDMNDVSASHVYRVIRGNDLRDAWADVGCGYAPTYNRHRLKYRIDHIFYRGDIPALTAKRIKGGTSDHYPIMVSFDMDK
jgi:endonuclease/exonuclease/phosphatase (EEP) superfamily protein YafD